jgi:hypothetical protein
MRQHRDLIGGTLLAGAAGCFLTGAGVVVGNQAHWSDNGVLGLIEESGRPDAATTASIHAGREAASQYG